MLDQFFVNTDLNFDIGLCDGKPSHPRAISDGKPSLSSRKQWWLTMQIGSDGFYASSRLVIYTSLQSERTF